MQIDLDAMREDAKSRIDRSIFSINPGIGWDDFRDQTTALCNDFLTLGAASLLVDMNPGMFFLNLCRCAENWRRFSVAGKEHCQQQASLSNAAPFHAAVITSNQALINKMLLAMPKKWQKGEEYQARFHTSWLLMLLADNNVIVSDAVDAHLHSLIDCEKEPQHSALIKALLGIDDMTEEDFWSIFETMLYQQDELIEQRAASAATPITGFAPHRYIWFEGLAWLRLAKLKGVNFVGKAYKHCPEEALLKMPVAYNNDWIILPGMNI